MYFHLQCVSRVQYPLTIAGILDQVKNAASQAVNTATDLANQAANSQVAATATQGAQTLGIQASAAVGAAAGVATNLATQAQDKASAVLPSIIPAVSNVDTRGDLSPTNEADRQKLDKLFADRADASELQNKGILKGGSS